MAPVGSILWRNLRVHQVYGANTEVGKTVLTTLLCRASTELSKSEQTSFLKPVSTGPDDEADTRHINLHAPGVSTTTLLQYSQPISPHAAARGKNAPSDTALLSLIHEHCSQAASAGPGWLFLETAGGVHSPSPSGTTQADLYSPLRLPVVLVGDAKLGGISLTISAYEALRLRGYDVESILMFEDDVYENAAYLRDYFGEKFDIPVVGVEAPPERARSQKADEERMMAYYAEVSARGTGVLKHLAARHAERIKRLESMPKKAHGTIWYPFTQQTLLTPESITAIDSARGDFFQTLTTQAPSSSSSSAPSTSAAAAPLLQPSFDGSASWWTQGLGHGSPSLTLAAAYAAGRYGHVMFAEAVHEPALGLAEALLKGMREGGNDRLTRVFYSDNGSTGVEVALKMALRAAAKRYGWDGEGTDVGKGQPVGVIGLKGGYHGDTLGAMECAEPSTFNAKVDWYRGRGVWLDYPTVLCVDGKWVVQIPGVLAGEKEQVVEFDTLGEVFDISGRKHSAVVKLYEEYVEKTLRHHLDQGYKLGALLIEPVVIGAGGMALADPLFQHVLVDVVRRSPHLFGTPESQPSSSGDWSGLPVIFDEVFTGLYRLGHFTSSALIDAQADISVHAKLLTGGLVPLCTTLASESIFEAFASNDKTDALLHGHSYTAHAVGCNVAVESLRQLTGRENQEKREGFRIKGGWVQEAGHKGVVAGSEKDVWSIWTLPFVKELSSQPSVAGVWALGSVLAIHLKAPDGAGYTSTVAVKLRDQLKRGLDEQGPGRWNVHSRVLGNVLYLMGSQATTEEGVEEIAELVKLAMREG